MDINNYIEYYPHIVDPDLCKKIVNFKFDYKKSTYSTHQGKSANTPERVKMDEFWIRKDNEFYIPLKVCFEKVIEKYEKKSTKQQVEDCGQLISKKKLSFNCFVHTGSNVLE